MDQRELGWMGFRPRPAETNALITPAEGMEAFARVFKIRASMGVVVSMRDLQNRIDQWINLEGIREESSPKKQELHQRPEISSDYMVPTNETEQQLVRIWGDLLGIGEIGIHDNFFELGGHSLLATQLISRIREMFNVELPLERLFEYPTISSLGECVETILWASSAPDTQLNHNRKEGTL